MSENAGRFEASGGCTRGERRSRRLHSIETMTLQTCWTVAPIVGLSNTVLLWAAADPAGNASASAAANEGLQRGLGWLAGRELRG